MWIRPSPWVWIPPHRSRRPRTSARSEATRRNVDAERGVPVILVHEGRRVSVGRPAAPRSRSTPAMTMTAASMYQTEGCRRDLRADRTLARRFGPRRLAHRRSRLAGGPSILDAPRQACAAIARTPRAPRYPAANGSRTRRHPVNRRRRESPRGTVVLGEHPVRRARRARPLHVLDGPAGSYATSQPDAAGASRDRRLRCT